MKTHMTANQKTDAEKKLLKLRKFLPVFILCPYTRAIFLGGSTALGTSCSKSDIDLFIVSRNNRVWLNKFFMTIFLSLVGERRTQKNLADKFCLNIFLSNKNPVLPHADKIGAVFYKNLLPVWSENKNEIKKFWETNSWIKNYCEILPISQKNIFDSKNAATNFSRKILEKIFDFSGIGFLMEKISFKFQKTYFKNKLKKSGAQNSKEYDFFVSPELIAYHFPISNYHKEFKKWNSQNLPR
jgi:hypothetical protein